MTITTHTAVGAIIGYSVGNPLLGFMIGMMSHFLLDMIPHGDSKISDKLRIHKKKKGPIAYGTIDSILAIFLILTLVGNPNYDHGTAFTAGIVGSILPDLLVGLFEITKSRYLKWFYKLHFFFHDYFVANHKDIKLHYSIMTQAAFVVIFLNLT